MKLTDMARYIIRNESEIAFSEEKFLTEEEFVEKIKACNTISNIASPLALNLNKNANILFLVLYYNKLITSGKLTPTQIKRVKALIYKQEDELFELCDSKYYKKNMKFKSDEFETTLDDDGADSSADLSADFSTGDQNHPTNSVRNILGLDN